jgi:6-phosphogluconolactonase (cycloisomerase 2 family)
MNIKSLLLSLHAISTAATTLYASHYDGHIFTLSLSASPDGSDNSLTLANTLQACGSMPSWLTLDADEHVLYCVDESGTNSYGNGTLSSFAISPNGSLTDSSTKVNTMPGGVASVIYQAGDKKFLAIAH